MKIELDKEFHDAADVKNFAETADDGIIMNESAEPEETDCSIDTIPSDTTDEDGKKKVCVPELISMTKILLSGSWKTTKGVYSGTMA